MTLRNTIKSASRVLVISGLLAGVCQAAQAAALFTLEGQTLDAKLASEAGVRVSMLGWTEADKAKQVVEQYRQYLTDKDGKKFDEFLQQQDTKGYLFTKEATGYTVKYAWKSDDALNPRTILLVTPALKTRNPYMWKQQGDSTAPFTLIELQQQGEELLMSTSLDTPIEVNLTGNLELQDAGDSNVFARLRDATPYYLKQSS
jgi:hypothetical protein